MVKTKLKGHQNRITGLAFSQISSGAAAQLCVWSIDGWEKKKPRFIPAQIGRQSPLVGETKVQFHNDQTHLLVAHESQIAVYDSKLYCLRSVIDGDGLPSVLKPPAGFVVVDTGRVLRASTKRIASILRTKSDLESRRSRRTRTQWTSPNSMIDEGKTDEENQKCAIRKLL